MTKLKMALEREKILKNLLDARTESLDFYIDKCNSLEKEVKNLKLIIMEEMNEIDFEDLESFA